MVDVKPNQTKPNQTYKLFFKMTEIGVKWAEDGWYAVKSTKELKCSSLRRHLSTSENVNWDHLKMNFYSKKSQCRINYFYASIQVKWNS